MASTNCASAIIHDAPQQEFNSTSTPDHKHAHRSSLSPNLESNKTSTDTHNLGPPTDESLAAHRAAALRQLNGAPLRSRQRNRPTKSTSSQTSLSSQPVIVRTYSGSRSRPQSQVRSSTPVPRDVMNADVRLPPVEAFTFDSILRAVEPEVKGAIDAIAEICARSKMSLADEYTAHMPPQGEITEGQRPRQLGHAHRGVTVDRPLTAVPEASSGSERSAGGSRASTSSGKGKTTAVGSLRNIMSGSGRGKAAQEPGKGPLTGLDDLQHAGGNFKQGQNGIERSHMAHDPRHRRAKSSSWIVTRNSQPSIAIASTPTALRTMSARGSTDFTTIHTATDTGQQSTTVGLAPVSPSRHWSRDLTHWLPWTFSQANDRPQKATSSMSLAELSLKDLLAGMQLKAKMRYQDVG